MVKVKLVDGGFSTQLSKYVGESIDGDPLWSARFLATEQEKCSLAHRDFVKAGADVITTGSYQSSIEGYKTYMGLNEMEALDLMRESVVLARRGIELAKEENDKIKEVLIAGSVGPYGACLHDGSEYTGSYSAKVTTDQLVCWHRPRVNALVEAGVDLLAFETIPCSIEALALLKLLKEYPNTKAWVSFSAKDSKRISNGEMFNEIVAKCWDYAKGQIVAVGVNCLHPSLVSPLFRKLKYTHPTIPLIVYPNSGETYDAAAGRWVDKENTVSVSEYIQDWLKLGVAYIGGCCRTNDKDIAQFAYEIKQFELRSK